MFSLEGRFSTRAKERKGSLRLRRFGGATGKNKTERKTGERLAVESRGGKLETRESRNGELGRQGNNWGGSFSRQERKKKKSRNKRGKIGGASAKERRKNLEIGGEGGIWGSQKNRGKTEKSKKLRLRGKGECFIGG